MMIFLSLSCSGCVAIVAGAVGYKLIKKGLSGPSRLTEEERKAIECRNFGENKDTVFKSVKEVFKNDGFIIHDTNYDKGIIAASSEEPSWDITASIEKYSENETTLRIVIKDKRKIVENKRAYERIFDNIQEELNK